MSWTLVHEGYAPGQERRREALCTLGNGVFATRGAAPDARASEHHYPGTYLAGGYDRATTEIAGHEVENEDLVNLPNWLPLTFRVEDGPWFSLDEVEVLAHRQELHLREGLFARETRFRDVAGRTTTWRERRLVSMRDPHLAALEVTLTPEDWSGRVTLRSAIDGAVCNTGVERYRELEGRHLEVLETSEVAPDTTLLRARTLQSRLEVVEAARVRLVRGVALARRTLAGEEEIAQELEAEAREGQPLELEKVVALHTSRDRAISEPGLAAREALERAGGFDELLEGHVAEWAHLWDRGDLELDNAADRDALLKLRLHVFHLLQTTSLHTVDLDVGVPARGWHGEAYRGHVFWDELFVFPFLNLRLPVLARALLRYRYRRLPAARRLAVDAGHAGAMFPWQSGSDGREESQRLHLNPRSGRWLPDPTHRQRHIGAAIAYNVWSYLQVTQDHDFLDSYGAELMLEIARFYASLAAWSPEHCRYRIRGVMGPDEFHTAYPDADPESEGGLDDNAYTNVMAAWVLARAGDVLDLLPRDRCRRLRERLALADEELERWDEVSRALRVVFHGDGLISQFDGYERLAELDWEGYRRRYGDVHRLDRILEAEGDSVNRYKASKQADVLMLFYLFSSEELGLIFQRLGYELDPAAIPRNVDYYLARTSHGSTLSRVVHARVLARSDRPRSWELFLDALDSDVLDVQGGTTEEGIHLGAMAGTVDLAQRCYTGLETRGNALHLDPCLPEPLRRLRVHVRYRRQHLDLDIDHERLRIHSRPFSAPRVTVVYRGHVREVSPGDTYSFRLVGPPARRGPRETGEPRGG